MYRGGYALCVFVDCAGAIDKLTFTAAEKALKEKGVQNQVAKWYMNYLENRTSMIELKGVARRILIETGCRQGGVLPVLLWNAVYYCPNSQKEEYAVSALLMMVH